METFGPNQPKKIRKTEKRFFNKAVAAAAVVFAILFFVAVFLILKKKDKLPFFNLGAVEREGGGKDLPEKSDVQKGENKTAPLSQEAVEKIMERSSGDNSTSEQDVIQESEVKPLSNEEIQSIMNSK